MGSCMVPWGLYFVQLFEVGSLISLTFQRWDSWGCYFNFKRRPLDLLSTSKGGAFGWLWSSSDFKGGRLEFMHFLKKVPRHCPSSFGFRFILNWGSHVQIGPLWKWMDIQDTPFQILREPLWKLKGQPDAPLEILRVPLLKLEGHPEGLALTLKRYLEGLLLKLARSSIGPRVEIRSSHSF